MGTVYRLLNDSTGVEASERRRVWLDPGVPVSVGRQTVVTLRFTVEDGSYEPFIEVYGPGVHLEIPMPSASEIDLGDVAGLIAIPRAAVSCGRSIYSVLVEFIRLSHIVRWAV